MIKHLAYFSQINRNHMAETGGKGANLGELTCAGFPVPPGFCIKVDVFDSFLETNNLNDPIAEMASAINFLSLKDVEKKTAKIRGLICHGEIPSDIANSIAEAYKNLIKGDDSPLVAIRSSVGTRDLAYSSFPGQMDTYHNVLGTEEVLRLVKECWASMWTARAASMMNASGINYRMVVIAPLVQLMVPAETAGVLFTVNPANGCDDEIMINACFGLGEAVVSGNITPDEYVVEKSRRDILTENIGNKSFKWLLDTKQGRGNRKIILSADDAARKCLTNEQIEELTEMGIQIEEYFDAPQDIEWAYAGGKLYLLQSRKIAGLHRIQDAQSQEEWISEFDTKITNPPHKYTSQNLGESLPGVLTPASHSMMKILDYGFWKVNRDLGLIDENFPVHDFDYLFLGNFYGKAHLNLTTFKEIVKKVPGASVAEFDRPQSCEDKDAPEITKFSLRLLPGLPRLVFGALRIRLSILKDLEKATRHLEEQIAANRKIDFAKKKLSEFADFLEQSREEAMKLMALHIGNSQLALASYDSLKSITKKWLGDTTGTFTSRLVTGLSTLESAKPGFAIFRLYQFVSESSELKELFLKTEAVRIWDKLNTEKGAFKEFKGMMDLFLQQYGYRSVSEAEMMAPSWEQDPSFVFSMIQNYLKADHIEDPRMMEARQRQDRIAAETEARAHLNPCQCIIFNLLLSEAQRFLPGRENNKALVIKGVNENKKIYHEISRRFLERGVLKEKDDIFFLTLKELLVLCRGEEPDIREKIKARRDEYIRNQDVALPNSFTGRPTPLNRGLSVQVPASHILTGLPVSPGYVTGPARVILDPKKDAYIESGEILVAPVTDASWTPLFLLAKAIVVDIGGLLSHGSIVAREYGIPGVLNVIVGTKVIKNGQMLTVNGTKGEVYIHEEAQKKEG